MCFGSGGARRDALAFFFLNDALDLSQFAG